MTGITDHLSRTAESLKGIGTGDLATAGGPRGDAKDDDARRDWKTAAADFAERWGVLIVFAVMIVVFSLLSPDVFPTWRNTLSILEQASVVVLLAVGLTVLVGVQSFIIVAGVIRVLPLTGVTLPFVSYGGSSLIANYVLLALLMRISDDTAATWAARILARGDVALTGRPSQSEGAGNRAASL